MITRRGALALATGVSLAGCLDGVFETEEVHSVTVPTSSDAWPVRDASPDRTLRNPSGSVERDAEATFFDQIANMRDLKVQGTDIVGLDDGYPTMYSRKDGNVSWRYDQRASQIALTEDYVLCNENSVTAVNRETGETEWTLADESDKSTQQTKFAVCDGKVVAGFSDGRIKTERKEWPSDNAEEGVSVELLVADDSVMMLREVESEKTVEGASVTETSTVLNVFDKGGEPQFQKRFSGLLTAVAASGDRVYIGTLEKSYSVSDNSTSYRNESATLHSVDLQSGEITSEFTAGTIPIQRLGIHGSDLIAIDERGLFKLSRNKLNEKWLTLESDDVSDEMAISDDTIFVSSEGQGRSRIHQIRVSNGSVQNTFEINSDQIDQVIKTSSGLYVRTGSPDQVIRLT